MAYVKDVVLGFASDECLEWPYTRTNAGYGQISIKGRRHNVSRYVCALVHGEPPERRFQAAHLCGNGHLGCVNPNHLVWKTPSANQLDRNVHGTDIRGEQHAMAKLTEQEVREMRRLSESHTATEIAKMFSISLAHTCKIIKNKSWQHV
ncbi:hypothetical protein EN816_00930 [Mesorhizobium sp. M8A.F.Ca.ET.173.01.1.1]|nr:hypothetical protein EN816_00930 [Mesorhizobium sp. M8A.F.Ca.ET.173.01.1.1]